MLEYLFYFHIYWSYNCTVALCHDQVTLIRLVYRLILQGLLCLYMRRWPWSVLIRTLHHQYISMLQLVHRACMPITTNNQSTKQLISTTLSTLTHNLTPTTREVKVGVPHLVDAAVFHLHLIHNTTHINGSTTLCFCCIGCCWTTKW